MRTDLSSRLRIYSDDNDLHEGKPLYQWLVEQAHEQELRGATVIRGVMGYGSHDQIHSGKVFALAADLPVIIELVDSQEKVQRFFASVSPVLRSGVATIEAVDATFFTESMSN